MNVLRILLLAMTAGVLAFVLYQAIERFEKMTLAYVREKEAQAGQRRRRPRLKIKN